MDLSSFTTTMIWSKESTTKSVLILSNKYIASIKMRVQTEEWRRFIPGVRMYKGKKTLFYNGEILWENGKSLIYDQEKRQSWEVIIVLPGVQVIPENTFLYCRNVKVVIMADAVRRVERGAFIWCLSLKFVRLSTNLEFIGV